MHPLEVEAAKGPMRPSNTARRVENLLQRIRDQVGLEENRQMVLSYDRQCNGNGNKEATRLCFLKTLHHLQEFAGKRSFQDLTRDDITEFLELERRGRFQDTRFRQRRSRSVPTLLSESTMNLRRHVVRKFFAFIHDFKKGYPPVVDWMKVRRIGRDKSRRINPSDLLTPREIYTIISYAESPRDKALLSFLAESGCRVGEASMLRVEDLAFCDRGVEVKLNGKTGPRTIPLVVSRPDLENWLNNFHLFACEPEAPLFPRFNRKQLRLNLHVSGIWNVVSKTVARARLVTTSLKTKNISPHSFRHARATELARLGWTEAMMRVYFGWTEDSRMPSTYIHLSQSDVASHYYGMYGRVNTDEEPCPKLEENRPCPHCGIRNPTGYITCFSCQMPIDAVSAQHREDKEFTVSTLNFIAQDTELSQKLLRLVEEADRRQRGVHSSVQIPSDGST